MREGAELITMPFQSSPEMEALPASCGAILQRHSAQARHTTAGHGHCRANGDLRRLDVLEAVHCVLSRDAQNVKS